MVYFVYNKTACPRTAHCSVQEREEDPDQTAGLRAGRDIRNYNLTIERDDLYEICDCGKANNFGLLTWQSGRAVITMIDWTLQRNKGENECY